MEVGGKVEENPVYDREVESGKSWGGWRGGGLAISKFFSLNAGCSLKAQN